MGRGVSETDVFAAADRLLVSGERPTVDRIRAVLGSGSPNTVIRYLDAWWANAGQRLAASVEKIALPDAPPAVTALATSFWTEALTAARGEIELALAGERVRLAEQWTLLEAERAADELQRREVTGELARMREGVSLLTTQLEASEAQRLAVYAENVRLLSDLERLTAAGDADRRALSVLQADLDKRQNAWDDERLAAAAYLRTVEDRAHQAVDESRQELKLARQANASATRDAVKRDAAHARDVTALARAKASAERNAATLLGRVQALETSLTALKPAVRRVTPRKATPRKRSRKTTSD